MIFLKILKHINSIILGLNNINYKNLKKHKTPTISCFSGYVVNFDTRHVLTSQLFFSSGLYDCKEEVTLYVCEPQWNRTCKVTMRVDQLINCWRAALVSWQHYGLDCDDNDNSESCPGLSLHDP